MYTNTVVINGIRFTNKIEASTYKDALVIQKNRKKQSKHTFEGRLILES